MYRSRVLQGGVALLALAVPVGAVSAGTTVPDDTATDSTEPPSAATVESGPPSASAPDDTSGDTSGGGQPPEDMDFQIDMMLGLVPEDEMQEYWGAQNQEREVQVQACMNEAGFEYEQQSSDMMEFDQFNGMTQLEWAQQYGYGNWTSLDPDNNPYGGGRMSDWPGDEVNNLPPEEQSAWWGVFDRCQQESYSNQDDPWSNPMVQQIMEDFYQNVENDQRVREALATWQDCMAEAGHPFADQDELYEEVYGGPEAEEMWELQSQFAESEAWLETSPDHAQWQALVDEEIEIAVADATCTPSLTEVRQEVTRDLRDELVAVWQTIDWSLPPVTYEEIMFPGDTLLEEPSGSDVGTSEPAGPDGTGAEPTETTETPVGLDLGGAPATTEA